MERLFVECAVRAALIAVVTAVVLRTIGIKLAAARHTAWTFGPSWRATAAASFGSRTGPVSQGLYATAWLAVVSRWSKSRRVGSATCSSTATCGAR